jgi:hypothetical protein
MKKATGLTRLNRELGGKRLELPKETDNPYHFADYQT